jgi:retron-type reverse transcriptase
MSILDENLESNLQQITKALKSESFVPHPVRRVSIPKPHGKTRPLGIPMCLAYCFSFQGAWE